MINKTKLWHKHFKIALEKRGNIREKSESEKREILKQCIIEANTNELVEGLVKMKQTHGLPPEITMKELFDKYGYGKDLTQNQKEEILQYLLSVS